jgi:hypothetical protein
VQSTPREYYRDVLSFETVATMNAGFCDLHVRRCPPSKQLLEVCTKVWRRAREVWRRVWERVCFSRQGYWYFLL